MFLVYNGYVIINKRTLQDSLYTHSRILIYLIVLAARLMKVSMIQTGVDTTLHVIC